MRLAKVVALAALATLLLGTSSISQQEETEEPVKMDDLPPPVKKTVLEVSQGVKLRGLTREVEKGETFYEAELDVNGRTRDVIMDPSGAIVLIEEEVALRSVPAAVRAAIEKHAEGGKIEVVETLTRNGKIEAYETHVKKGAKKIEFKVDPAGQLIVESNPAKATGEEENEDKEREDEGKDEPPENG